MKRRNSALVLLFSFATGGIYLIYWLLCLVEEINHYKNEERINYKKLIIKFSCVFLLFLTFFGIMFISINSDDISQAFIIIFLVCFALVIYWFVLIIGTVMKIATEINLIQNENNIESPIKPKLATILYFVYFSGIVYIQKNINKTVDVIGVDNEKCKKSLIITIVYSLLLLIMVLSVFLGVFKEAGLIGEKREPLIVLGITSTGNQDASFSIEKAGTYALWVNCNFEYSNGFSPLLNITITKNDDIIVKKQYNPLKTPLTVNSVETTVNGKTKKLFRGRFEKIDFETGDYEIMVESIIGEHLIQLNEYQFYIQ